MNWVTLNINGSDVSVAFDANSVHIYNAYPIKDDLKSRGYRWDPADKSWHISPGDVENEMQVLKNNLQVSQAPAAPLEKVKPGGKTELPVFPRSYSVADLRDRLDRLIREGIRGNIWVRGVIASVVKNYKWYSYLDLKDEDGGRDIFFRVEIKKPNMEKINRKLAESGVARALEKDLPVFCNVEVYLPLRNVVDVRLSLLDILPEYTQSKIRNQREITLEKLKEEGIFGDQKKLVLPAFISRIGLITSEQGTSVKDIRAGLFPYNDKYDFFFVDSRMEGTGAVDGIIAALDFLENNPGIDLDALVIARGGGSEQSLAVFNDLRLCRRVCRARLPVLTAIGHEKDVSAVELCSWLTPTPSTPSGIGKYLQNRCLDLQDRLFGTVTALIHHFTNVHHREMGKIKSFLKNIPSRVVGSFRVKEDRFFSLTRGLERSVAFTVRDQEGRIASLTSQISGKCRNLHLRDKQKIDGFARSILARAGSIYRREVRQVEKTIGKLDFEKRNRDNLEQREDVRRNARALIARALKNVDDTRRDLDVRMQLVRAADPLNILKKGFTLTLDEENRVIKTLKDFDRKKRATLRFHDGSADIIKIEKEET